MKYIGHAFSWEQGSWLTAGVILLGSSFLALSPMADNLVSISHCFGLSMLFAGYAPVFLWRLGIVFWNFKSGLTMRDKRILNKTDNFN